MHLEGAVLFAEEGSETGEVGWPPRGLRLGSNRGGCEPRLRKLKGDAFSSQALLPFRCDASCEVRTSSHGGGGRLSINRWLVRAFH